MIKCRTPKCENFNKCNKAPLSSMLFLPQIHSREAKCEDGLRGGARLMFSFPQNECNNLDVPYTL